MTTKVILMYDQLDTAPAFYVLNVTDAELEILKTAHSKYTNSVDLTTDDENALDCVYNATVNSAQANYFEGEAALWHGRWFNMKADLSSPLAIPADAKFIFYAGFLP